MLVLAVYRLIGERSNLIPSGVMSTIDPPLEEMRPPKTRGSHAFAWLPTMLLLALLAASGTFVMHSLTLKGEQLILFALSLLAVIGVFFLFASAVGMIRLREAAAPPDFVRTYIEQSDDAIELLDANGQIVFTNAAMHQLLRAPKIDQPFDRLEQLLVGEAQASEAYFRLVRAAERGQSADELVPLTRSGVWLRLSVRCIGAHGAGKLTAWRATDMTHEQSRNAHAVKQLEDSVRYLDALPVGFLTHSADGQVEHMNATLRQWLKQDTAKARTEKLRLADIIAGDAAELLRVTEDDDGNSSAEPLQFDLDLKAKDGSTRPVRVLHQPSSRIEGGRARTLILDRSPGHALDEDGRAAEVRFARFFQSAPFGLATVTRGGKITSTNGTFAKIFAKSKRGALQSFPKLAAGISDPIQRQMLEDALASALDGKPPCDLIEVSFGGKQEATHRFYFGPAPQAAAAGQASADDASALVYVIDATEQKALELKFAQSQKMEAVGQLAGGIAHDFNNVLTAIIGFSDLLLQNQRPTDPTFKDVTHIRDNAVRAAGLVRQLLAFSRRQTLLPEVLTVSEVISDHSIMLSRYISEKVALKLVHGRDLWFVKADRTQLEQVLMNLAINARDAMPNGGSLTIRTRNVGERESEKLKSLSIEPGEYVLCEVEDTGSGMSPEVMAKIFEPFFSTKDVGKGTGLGLSTVYGIVKQTGGYVYPESVIGKGTIFRVYLPRYVPAVDEVEAAQRLAEKKERDKDRPRDLTGTGCVLLVEDEDAVRNFAKRALERQGYEVLEASTGVEALELMETDGDRVDVVVSDVVMPEMDGPTLLTNLRKRWPDIKVIFVSGYPDDAFRKSLADGEQFEFLAKPFRLPQLAAKVKEVILS
jgi:two-component system, cell cycle sensor histidine kinase and response regulator CckA